MLMVMSKQIQKILALLILSMVGGMILSGCMKKQQGGRAVVNTQRTQLVYYKLFDEEDVMRPLIQQYQALHPNVTIKYKKFDNADDYYRTILNELAEGEGPDIFSVPNYWLKKNAKKITPLDAQVLGPKQFAATFASVAEKDAVFTDPRDGGVKVFGLPMGIDTLALYYNKNLYEDRVPSRGRPAATWEEFKDDVFRLTKADNSFERFEVGGVAMGRFDNIARAMDILYMLMLQYKVDFYNDAMNAAEFMKQQAVSGGGSSFNPASKALDLYTSFALASQKNYSWNEYMVEPTSAVKEVEAFARGKVAMIFGYSYLYEQIMDEMDQLKKKNVQTITPDAVRISVVPQVNDPRTSTEKRDAYANYFVETVSRNSANPKTAWDFLMFATSRDNLVYYNQKTHRPTSRRDLIEKQKEDAIYGVFAEQVGYAESLPIYDWDLYKNIFAKAVEAVLSTVDKPEAAMRKAESEINLILPPEGILLKPPLLPVGGKSSSGPNSVPPAASAPKNDNTKNNASTETKTKSR